MFNFLLSTNYFGELFFAFVSLMSCIQNDKRKVKELKSTNCFDELFLHLIVMS